MLFRATISHNKSYEYFWVIWGALVIGAIFLPFVEQCQQFVGIYYDNKLWYVDVKLVWF